MSEEKLKLSQKMFAALERLIREARVKDLELELEVKTKSLEYSLTASTQSPDFALTAPVKETPLTLAVNPVEIVYRLSNPVIGTASLDTLTTRVVDEEVERINTAAVFTEPFQAITTAEVKDLFKEYHIVPGRLPASHQIASATGSSGSLVKNLEFHLVPPRQHLGVHSVPESRLKITPQIKENVFYFKRLTLQKRPVKLSFLSEQQQLIYWRQAVLKSRKEPRQLQIAGVYTGIPYDCVENLKINAQQNTLQYNFKTGSQFQGSRCPLKNIALFNDLSENKVLVVVT
jgi:hypothetical protein